MLSKCKKALALKLKGYNVNFKFEKLSYTGTLLHKVLNNFAKTVNQGLFNEFDTKNIEVESIIKNRLYEIFLKEIDKDKKSALDLVWKYLEDFSVLLSTLVEENDVSSKDTFIFSEKPFKYKLTDDIAIKGRFDVLLRVGDKVKIIDYKTGKDDFERDIFQISLYHEAVRNILGIEAEPHVIYFQDGKIMVETYTHEEIKITIEFIKELLTSFINEFESEEIRPPTKNREICKFCSMRNYSFCKFT
ncbi:hypothetical protein CSE_06170 [Caldisericum exile AZM16c01]|uniref:PD-(D/E)XK endonuclease-like domain-containing protein n=2 Tax=Caldisericum exile TaxID=693075 RepID=A0A7U6GE61_CALEA|nr:hypothetical protein CSE_06170 [Caldisericum exile AZM16c01]